MSGLERLKSIDGGAHCLAEVLHLRYFVRLETSMRRRRDYNVENVEEDRGVGENRDMSE